MCAGMAPRHGDRAVWVIYPRGKTTAGKITRGVWPTRHGVRSVRANFARGMQVGVIRPPFDRDWRWKRVRFGFLVSVRLSIMAIRWVFFDNLTKRSAQVDLEGATVGLPNRVVGTVGQASSGTSVIGTGYFAQGDVLPRKIAFRPIARGGNRDNRLYIGRKPAIFGWKRIRGARASKTRLTRVPRSAGPA